MESLVFGLVIFAIGYIVYWSFKNDNVKSISEQRGLIRMRNHEDPDPNSTPKSG